MASQSFLTPISTPIAAPIAAHHKVQRYSQRIDSRLDQLVPGCSAALTQACRETPDLVPYRVRQALNRLLTPALVPTVVEGLLNLPRAEQGYTRHILHADLQGRFTVTALVWGPGQSSPVHAHYTWCAFRVLCGVLSETHYAWDAAAGHAYPINSIPRIAGQSVCGHAGLELIHRLGNTLQDTSVPAVSLHVYGIEAERVATHVNRVLASVQSVT
jgi:predicted metal-dependent enzyme (double-stranded beta helix superfamily)